MLAIGLMSGTSCDGVDASLIETDGISIGRYVADYHLPYPAALQQALSELMQTRSNWFELENQLTRYHAEAARKLLVLAKKSDNLIRPVIIGFHGQTIYHAPDQGICWQIGNPHLLAYLTKIDVVSDFRRKDVANGGQGAPLVPIFHQALAHDRMLPVAFVNIGGVSNVTYVGKNDYLAGYDLGAGNALINDVMMLYYNKPYDEDGIIAKSGRVDQAIVMQLMLDEFFKKIPPKSLDRNHFNKVMELLKNHKSEDIVATLTMFAAESIACGLSKDFLRKIGAEIPEVLYLCGGGGKNKTLVDFLQIKMLQTRVAHVEELGLKSDYIESQAFAYLAARCLKGLPSTFPATTGAKVPGVAGVLFNA